MPDSRMTRQAEPVAWQDKAKPTEIVAAEDWENIDPAWHWMYRPLYAEPQQTVLDAVLVEREACAKVCDELAYFDAGDSAEAMRHCAQDIRARGKE